MKVPFRKPQIEIWELDPVQLTGCPHVLSPRRFRKLVPIHGLPHPILNSETGGLIYLAKKVDWGCRGSFIRRRARRLPTVDWGDVHSSAGAPAFLLCYRECCDAWSAEFGKLATRNVELEFMPWLEGRKMAVGIMNKVFSAMGLGKDVSESSDSSGSSESAEDGESDHAD